MRVKISRIARDRALTSMAQMPRMIGGRPMSMEMERSDCDPLGDGDDVRVAIELDRGELRSEWSFEEWKSELRRPVRIVAGGRVRSCAARASAPNVELGARFFRAVTLEGTDRLGFQ
jgi:hypothetical protein